MGPTGLWVPRRRPHASHSVIPMHHHKRFGTCNTGPGGSGHRVLPIGGAQNSRHSAVGSLFMSSFLQSANSNCIWTSSQGG